MHDIKALLAIARRQPETNPQRDFESALGLVPPGVVAAFSQQAAAMLAEVAQQISAFHKARASSS